MDIFWLWPEEGDRGMNFLPLWLQEIQDALLPPSVHMYPRKKVKASKQLSTNGGIQKYEDDSKTALALDVPLSENKRTDNGHARKSAEPFPDVKTDSITSSSPYPHVCSLQLSFLFCIVQSCHIYEIMFWYIRKKQNSMSW